MEKPFCSPGLSSETTSLLVNTDSIVIKDIDQHESPTKIVIVIEDASGFAVDLTINQLDV